MAVASSCPKLVLPAAVNPSTATRSRPGLSRAIRPATSLIRLDRTADAGDGSGCRHVETDSKAATSRAGELLRSTPAEPRSPGQQQQFPGGAPGGQVVVGPGSVGQRVGPADPDRELA